MSQYGSTSSSSSLLISQSSNQQDLMSLPINIKNYKTKYKALLDCEESVHARVLKNKCNGVYNITFIIKPEDIITDRPIDEPDIKLFARIEGLTMAQITYSMQASSHVVITMKKTPSLIMNGHLLKCNTATIELYIGFNENNFDKFKSFYSHLLGHLPAAVENVYVDFQIKKLYFNNLRKILERLSKKALDRIIPKNSDFKEVIKFIEKYKSTRLFKLDNDQFHGLQTILSPTCTAPVLITGPFGCGKTCLLVVATHCIMSKSIQNKSPGRVLLCCYQQQSADMILEQYLNYSQFDGINTTCIFRLTNQHYHAKHHLNEFICTVSHFCDNFRRWYARESHVIIVTTFVCAMRMSDVVPNDYFTHIFIDEGVQTREPETLGPLLLANINTRILITGDTLQAGPSLSVLGKEPLQYGLDQPLLQRLHSQYSEIGGTALQYIVSLRTNYRCHPDLLELPSSLFYHKSKLIPFVEKTNSTFPLQFVCSSFSFNYPDNPESVDECLLILDKVKEFLSSSDFMNFTVSDVCVVAASLNQVNLICRTIYNSGDYSSLRGINIRTSYDMQGREFSLLFMSTIESLQATGIPHDTLKSLSQSAVFNTVITRAKSLVVVVGNPLVLMLSEGTMTKPMWIWREFIERCFKNNTFMVPLCLQAEYSTIQIKLKCALETRAFIDNTSLEKLVLTASPVHIPTSGPVPHVTTIGPVSHVPTIEPVPHVPTSGPVPHVPTIEPVPHVPTSGPVPHVPTIEPVPHVPTIEPVPYVPTSGPVPHVPTIEPVPHVPTSGPVSHVPTIEPVPHVPTSGPVPHVPTIEPVPHVPTSGPVPHVPTIEPVPHVPTSGPVSHVPTSGPVSHVPTSGPVPHVPTIGPVPHVPTSEPVPHVPTIGPVPHVPTSGPVSHVPTSEPVPHVPTIGPVPHVPTSGPVSHVPTSGPVPHVPTSGPVSHVPTSGLVPHVPTSGPVSHVPTSEPVPHVPTSGPVPHVPTSRPVSHVPTSGLVPHVPTSGPVSHFPSCGPVFHVLTIRPVFHVLSSGPAPHVPTNRPVSHVPSSGLVSLPHPSSEPVYQLCVSESATIASSNMRSHSPTPQAQEQESEWPDICSYPTKAKSMPSTHDVTSSSETAPVSPCMTAYPPLSPSLSTSKKQGKKKKSKDTTFDKPTTSVESGSSRQKHNQSYREKNNHTVTLFDAMPASFIAKTEQQLTRNRKKATKPEEINKPSRPFSHDHLPYNEDLIKAPLSSDNYCEKFHQLLCREEDEHERILNEKCNGHYTVTVYQTGFIPYLKHAEKEEHVRYGLISGDNLNGDIISYIKQASAERDNIELHLNENVTVRTEIIEGFTPKRESIDILIAFTNGELDKLITVYPSLKRLPVNIENVRVSFVLKWSYFDRLHKGIDSMSPDIISRLCDNFQFSTNIDKKDLHVPKPPFDCISLDHEAGYNSQMNALRTIVSANINSPVLIVGSFGTGKTRLLASAAYEILRQKFRNRVLICAHHQHSADTFIEKYFASMHREGWNVWPIRLIPQNNVYKIKQDCEQYYANVHDLMKKRNFRLVVSTFSTSLGLVNRLRKGYFTHILIDEGAQSREPESIIPLCLADFNTQIVIAGDHKQVGPSLLVLGQDAIDGGLSKSLLERLHESYESVGSSSLSHRATLVTNFRCHHAILSLPSYLFYDSALCTSSQLANNVHISTDLPLYFIASNLNRQIHVEKGVCEVEAELLLQQVLKYVNERKETREEIDLKNIGIIATTANQKSELFKQLHSKYQDLSQVDVITIDIIQGREYDAVFLSTVEPTTPKGASMNLTKTPCSQYVFNTALTRAKSLVVCAGNPFLLMTIEEQMNNESHCWMEYIRRSMISKTFSVPKEALKNITNTDSISSGTMSSNAKSSVGNCNTSTDIDINQVFSELQKIIFSYNFDSLTDHDQVKNDSILKSYQNALRKLPHYRKSKIRIDEVKQNWKITELETDIGGQVDPDEDNDNNPIECKLEVDSVYKTKAIPRNQGQRPIKISRFIYRRGAFDGDIVNVQIIKDLKTANGQECGRVVSVVKPMHPTKYVCRSDPYNKINFYPLDRTVPGIVNLPKISKKLLQYNNGELLHDEYITVFSQSSLFAKDGTEGALPQIKELIPFSMAGKFLFIVQVLKWDQKFWKPLGAVIEVLPRTSNLFFTERLLKIAHDINDTPYNDPFPEDKHEISDEIPHYDRAFTIDSEDTVNMDDALSCVPTQTGVYEFGVHITNVAKFIPQGHELDKWAKSKGTSVYGTSGQAIHMLPSRLSFDCLSLQYRKSRHALSLIASVSIVNDQVYDIQYNVIEEGPICSKVISQAKLTYEIAQKLIDGQSILNNQEASEQVQHFDDSRNGGLTMSETLKLLYRIALKLRQDRLGCPYPEGDICETWQSKMLVSELMIWANSTIANYLINKLPELALVRCQQRPLPDQLKSLGKYYKDVLPYSIALQHLLEEIKEEEMEEGEMEEGYREEEEEEEEEEKKDKDKKKDERGDEVEQREEREEVKPLIVTNSLLSFIHSSYNNHNYKQLLWALSNDSLYPQLSQAQTAARRINRSAEYIPVNKQEDISHYGLKLQAYTHFTSPIRRYFDILVQRLVNSCLEKSDIDYKLEDLIELCHHLNRKTRLANRFEQSLSKVKQVQEVESNLVKVNGFLSKCSRKKSDSMYQLLICDQDRLEDSNKFDTLFDYSHLNIKKYDDRTIPEWRIVSIDLENSPDYYSNLGNFIKITDEHAESDSSLTEIDFCHFRAFVFDYWSSTDESQNVNDRQMKRTCYMSQHGDSNVHLIDYESWKLVHECLERHSKYSIDRAMEKLPQPTPTCKEINSPLPSVPYPVITFDIKRSFKNGELFTGWMGKSLTDPIPTSCLQLIEIGPSFQICLQHNRSPSLCFSESQLEQASRSEYNSIKEYIDWMGKSLTDPIPTPCLQLIEIRPSFQICLQHNRSPSLCFSESQLEQASRSEYNSIKEYIDLWSKVLIAEAANDGVQQTKTVYLFRNVVLEWPTIIQVNNCVDNIHYEPVKDGCVSFTISIGKLDLLNYVNIKVGDLVCVRYNKVSDSGSLLTSVYHFVVTEKEGETFTRHSRSNALSPVIIKMRSMNDNCWISNELKPYLNTAKCDMQVIGMPVSFNRVFKRLQKGSPVTNQSRGQRNIHKWSKTAINISLGYTGISSSTKVEKEEFLKGDQLGEFLKNDSFALKLWETNGSLNDGSLNDEQEKAIGLSIRNKFQLIQGPPGTGKTIVGAHLVYIFSKLNATINQPNEHCVLYCCPSNKAVDVVHKKLQGLNMKLGSNRLRIIRLYGRSHEQKDHPNPCYDISGRSHEEAEPEGRCLKEFKNDALHFKIRQENDKIEKLRQEFKELTVKGVIPSITEQKRYNQLIKDTEKRVLSQHYDIILCTCNETCSRRLLVANMEQGEHRRIRYCIIDECGMAHEPETIAAASLSEHVTLIGDHKQLQPVIKYSQAKECGLSTSLFERYAKVLNDPGYLGEPDDKLLIQLNIQYRMHETICEGSSQLFYDDSLVTDESVKKRSPLLKGVEEYWIQDNHVMIYDVIDTKSDETLPYSSHYDIHSKSNKTEAKLVLSVAHLLHIQHQVPYKSIAVLTPYAAQKELLKRMMSEDDKFKNNDPPKVTTVVESQGDEYDIVILTTVRSLPLGEIKDKRLVQPDRRWMTENLGFLTDEHQINVAITRAKHGLIIIGNVTLLSYVDSWKSLFEMYRTNTQ